MNTFKDVQIIIPQDDAPISLDIDAEAATFNPVKGLLVVIEYLDSYGYLSRRKIQMLRMSRQHDNDTLYAFCLTEDGFRSFKIENIQCFILADGQICAPAEFWADIGIIPSALARTDPKALKKHAGSVLGPELIVLAGMSESDGDMRSSEIDAIIEYAEIALEDEGILLTAEDCRALRQYIRRLGPTPDTIAAAAQRLLDNRFGKQHLCLSANRRRRFLAAIDRVMTADGIIHPAEHAFMTEIAHLLKKSDR